MGDSAKEIRVITVARVLCALALGWAAAHFFPLQRFFPPGPSAYPTAAHIGETNHLSTPFGHPYYRYSVIPGGVYTAEELKTALAHDPVAASHYAGFKTDKTHVVTLKSDKSYYLSYRIGDKLYWTRRPIQLHKGEALLTDGVYYARTRCGNRLSDHPTAQAARLADPDESVFNIPAAVQTAWTTHASEIDAAADLPFQIAGNRITGLPEPLANLLKLSTPEPPPADVERDYIPTPHEHEKPPIFVTDGPSNGTIVPALLPSETPSASGVPEPGTAALGGLALIGIALLGRQRMRKRQ